jgi:hypothetical protein
VLLVPRSHPLNRAHAGFVYERDSRGRISSIDKLSYFSADLI